MKFIVLPSEETWKQCNAYMFVWYTGNLLSSLMAMDDDFSDDGSEEHSPIEPRQVELD